MAQLEQKLLGGFEIGRRFERQKNLIFCFLHAVTGSKGLCQIVVRFGRIAGLKLQHGLIFPDRSARLAAVKQQAAKPVVNFLIFRINVIQLSERIFCMRRLA